MSKPKKKQTKYDKLPFSTYEIAGDYFVGYGRYETKEGITIIPIPPDVQKTMAGRSSYMLNRLEKTLFGVTGAGNEVAVFTAAHYLSPIAVAGIGTLGLLGMAGVFAQKQARNVYNRKKRFRIEKGMPERANKMRFPDRQIKFDLPQDVLENEVEFLSENGSTTRTVGNLLESSKDLTGIILETQEEARVKGKIDPEHLVRSALLRTRESGRGSFLSDCEMSLQMVSQACAALPSDYKRNLENIPASLRESDERISSQLLIGSLGVYGTLRAHVGVQVADTIKDLFAERGEDALVDTAFRFENPTAENLSWNEMRQTQDYINGISATYK